MILNKKKNNLIPTKSSLKIKKKGGGQGHQKTPSKSGGKNQILIKTSNAVIENPASFLSPVNQGPDHFTHNNIQSSYSQNSLIKRVQGFSKVQSSKKIKINNY